MIQKKICLLGGFAVGKTSLIRRFVTGMFSELYQTTIGVTIEKKTLLIDERDATLMIWDLYGDDDFQNMRESYLRGSSGYILVADGMRQSTLDTAEALHQLTQSTLGPVPFVLMVHSTDRAYRIKRITPKSSRPTLSQHPDIATAPMRQRPGKTASKPPSTLNYHAHNL